MQTELLNEGLIGAGLASATRAWIDEIRVHSELDSTMAELARRGSVPGAARICLAEQQSAGRGRRGRGWISPAGGNVYLSVNWIFPGGPESLSGLSLAVGVALSEALETLGARQLSLKWPNDLLRDGHKLAGILVELQGDVTGACTAIVGIGINVAMPPASAPQIEQPWSDLHDLAASRNEIVSSVLNVLVPLLAGYEDCGFRSYRARWEQRHAHADAMVSVEQAGALLVGLARGVDDTGALLLAGESGTVAIHGGDVSLRPIR